MGGLWESVRLDPGEARRGGRGGEDEGTERHSSHCLSSFGEIYHCSLFLTTSPIPLITTALFSSFAPPNGCGRRQRSFAGCGGKVERTWRRSLGWFRVILPTLRHRSFASFPFRRCHLPPSRDRIQPSRLPIPIHLLMGAYCLDLVRRARKCGRQTQRKFEQQAKGSSRNER